jgi:hypothetical protein
MPEPSRLSGKLLTRVLEEKFFLSISLTSKDNGRDIL